MNLRRMSIGPARRARRALRGLWRALKARLPRELSAALTYREFHGRWPDLSNPRRFSEYVVLQKLRGDHATFARLSDKIAAKAFVAERIGPAFVVPTLWSGVALPPGGPPGCPFPFILKASHGSGMYAPVRGPAEADWDRLRATTAGWMATDWPAWLQEGWYNRIERRILAEPLLGDGTEAPTDYKFLVFGGRAALVQVARARFRRVLQSFYSLDWVRQPFDSRVEHDPEDLPRPPHLAEMIAAAEALGQGFDFVRVDFYDLPDGPRFGELTFSPWAGLDDLRPDSAALAMGELWRAALERRGRAPTGG